MTTEQKWVREGEKERDKQANGQQKELHEMYEARWLIANFGVCECVFEICNFKI